MYTLFLFLLLSTILASSLTLSPSDLNPDTGLSITELVTKYGYPIEAHEIQTEDGYLLTLHRIPHGLGNVNDTKKPVVFLMHGILCSSGNWVSIGPERGLGFLLAEAGFDVWLGNQRGNLWSRRHVELDPEADAANFFDFSYHEIGYYDLPASIDYILNFTGQDQLSFVGYSQGTTAFFVMASERPEYNEKIKFMSALGPAAFMENLPNPYFRLIEKNFSLLQLLVTVLGIHEFLPHYGFFTELGASICGEGSEYQELCADILFVIGGPDSPQLDRNYIPVLLTETPAGSSMRQIFHYLQGVNSTTFSQYDYGFLGNELKYGQSHPPQYDLSKVTAPVALHYAPNDWLTSPIDVERLAGELPNVVLAKKVPNEKFAHLDFLWAKDLVELVNGEVVSELLKNLQ